MYKPVWLDVRGKVEQQLGRAEWLGGAEQRLGGAGWRLGGAEWRLGRAERRLGRVEWERQQSFVEWQSFWVFPLQLPPFRIAST